jgi:hypothetical protein
VFEAVREAAAELDRQRPLDTPPASFLAQALEQRQPASAEVDKAPPVELCAVRGPLRPFVRPF